MNRSSSTQLINMQTLEEESANTLTEAVVAANLPETIGKWPQKDARIRVHVHHVNQHDRRKITMRLMLLRKLYDHVLADVR